MRYSFPSRRTTLRSGYTLLEVVLAAAISVMVLIALYLALSIQYRHARSGREILQETTVARSVLLRLSQDIRGQLSPFDPLLFNNLNGTTTLGAAFGGGNGNGGGSSGSGSSSMSSGGSGGGTSGGSSQGGSSGSTGSTSSSGNSSGGSTGSSSTSNGTSTTAVFNLGVYGESNRLVLTGSWLPRDLTQPQPTPSLTSDLRRVTYWLITDGDKKGLARQELTGITGPDAGALPPDGIGDPSPYIIAPEVSQFTLEYFDGQTWQPTWDGTVLDTNTGLPLGPPAAIAINITLTSQGSRPGEKGGEVSFRHVVAIPAANSFIQSQNAAPSP